MSARPGGRRGAVLALALTACRHHAPVEAPDQAPSVLVGGAAVERHPIAGVRDAAASGDTVLALATAGLVDARTGRVLLPSEAVATWDTLRAGSAGWTLEGACDDGRCAAELTLDPPTVGPTRPVVAVTPVPSPPSEDLGQVVAAVGAAGARGRAEGWRIPFTPVAVAPGGVPIALARSTGRLMRAGQPPVMAPVPVASSPCTLPAPFVFHPSGKALYLVSWPGQSLRAFDPVALTPLWSVELENPAQGLFLDASGRFVVLGEGPDVDDCFADWPVDPPADASTVTDPSRDERLRRQERPPMTAVVVVDTTQHRVVLRAPGRFLGWDPAPVGDQPRFLVTTSDEVDLYTPEPTP